jgi:TetR/AcrR family transcriptional repressor of nem operon
MPWEKQFDRDEALDRAVRTFWKRGYEGCSMNVLLKGMGIQKGSFYATYHGKHRVLIEALRRYADQRLEEFRRQTEGQSPLAGLRRHLDSVLAESVGPESRMGCLMVNSALELAPQDAAVRALVEKTWGAHREFYRRVLDAAKAAGELPPDYDTGARSSALLAIVLGIRVLARGGAPAATIRAARQEADALLAPPGSS